MLGYSLSEGRNSHFVYPSGVCRKHLAAVQLFPPTSNASESRERRSMFGCFGNCRASISVHRTCTEGSERDFQITDRAAPNSGTRNPEKCARVTGQLARFGQKPEARPIANSWFSLLIAFVYNGPPAFIFQPDVVSAA